MNGVGGIHREVGMHTHTPWTLWIEQMSNENLLHSTGVCGPSMESKSQIRGDAWIRGADSLQGTAEINPAW